MNKLFVSLLLTLGISGLAHAAGDAAAGQGKIAMCSACHNADGNSMVPNFPKLAGHGERYLLKQMHDIKSGARPVVEMTGMLDAMTRARFSRHCCLVCQPKRYDWCCRSSAC